MKAIVSALLVLAVLVSAVPMFVSADNSNASESAYSLLLSGLLSYSEEIDISELGLTAGEMHSVLDSIYKNEPMLYYWGGRYSYSYFSEDEPLEVFPHYNMSAEERAEADEYINSVLDAVIATVPEEISDYEKALYLHDYVCVNYEYDKSYKTVDIYNMIKNGAGICTGYTLLYDELLTRVGIESRAVVSPVTELNHMWNQVYIGGYWYHVDTTWDDPLPNRFGEVRHLNFLLDDIAIAVSHAGVYYAEHECLDPTFDLMPWRLYNSQFAFVNGNIYAVEFNEIVSFDLYYSFCNSVCTVASEGWYSSDGFYLGFCIGLGAQGTWIYSNDQTRIIAYNPITKATKTAFGIENTESQIIGSYVLGNMLYYLETPTGYAEQGEIKCIELAPIVELGGDANGDGTLDQYDYIYVKRAYFGTLSLGAAEIKRADVNKDNALNQYDYILVKRAYFGTYVFE